MKTLNFKPFIGLFIFVLFFISCTIIVFFVHDVLAKIFSIPYNEDKSCILCFIFGILFIISNMVCGVICVNLFSDNKI